MNTITSIRLVNRSFIKEAPDDSRLLYVSDFLAVCDKHGIGARIGTIGVEQPGPFVEAIYKRPETVITVDNFSNFLTEISNCFDMYRGVQPYTICEFDVQFILDRQGVEYEGRTQFVLFHNHETERVEQKAFDKQRHLILGIKPKLQIRITIEDIANARRQSLFLQTNRGDDGSSSSNAASGDRQSQEALIREERNTDSNIGVSCSSAGNA